MEIIKPQVDFNFNPRLLATLCLGRQNQPMVTKTKKFSPIWLEIEAALKRAGKTQEWLAGELGLSNNAISKWKYGGKISRENAIKVALLLDIPLDRLLTGKHNPVVEVLTLLPPAKSRSMVAQFMYQIEHADDVLTKDQIIHYLKAISDWMKDMEKRKKK